MNFFDRIANSFSLAKSSWQVLWTDKKLVAFPILSGISCFLVLLSFASPFVVFPGMLDFLNDVKLNNNNNPQPPIWLYAYTFAFYFANYFVIIFFNSALVSCALIRFNGGEPTLGDGLRMAFRRLPQIFAWALVSATVGVLLKVIERSHEKAGAIISAILGAAWSIMTYFVVPVLVVEQVGPFTAVKRSIGILSKTWGEALVGSFGLGFFKFLLTIPGIILLVVGVLLCTVNVVVGLVVVGLAIVYFVLCAAVCAALDGIYLSALYQYAVNGSVPSAFEQRTMAGAFSSR